MYEYNMMCPYYHYLHPYCCPGCRLPKLKDYGPDPFVINIEKATKRNNYFRMALWTGEYLQHPNGYKGRGGCRIRKAH